MKKKWSKKDEEFLINNYPNYGLEYCSKKLKTGKYSTRYMVTRLKLKLNESGKKITSKIGSEKRLENIVHRVNEKLFINNHNEYSTYLLGLLWADGYIKENGTIVLSCVKDDMLIFKKILEKCGSWNYYESKRGNTKTQISAITTNKKLTNFLIKFNYRQKSINTPTILNIIPQNLRHYFFRGWIDGDGCFYENQKNKCFQFSLTSAYNQDWCTFTTMLNSLSIKHKINRRILITKLNKENKSSTIRINSKKEIKKLGDYIYQNFNIENIGLERKHKKFLSITNNF